MRKSAISLLVAALAVIACGSVASQSVDVSITDRAWTAGPAAFAGGFGQLEYRVANNGTEAHQVIVGSALVTPTDFEKHIADHGLVNLIAELQGLEAHGIGAALIRGHRGHYHPGGPDEVDLPAHAMVALEDDGQLVRWFYADPLEPGGVADGTSRAGKPAESAVFGTVSYIVLCADPDHSDRGEFVVFGTEG